MTTAALRPSLSLRVERVLVSGSLGAALQRLLSFNKVTVTDNTLLHVFLVHIYYPGHSKVAVFSWEVSCWMLFS